MSLSDLSRTILLLVGNPISRVRLARIIYFVHKDLIRKKFMQPDDIRYLRSPLGPVPEGYLSLSRRHGIAAQPNVSSSLSYTSEDYAVDTPEDDADLLEQYREVLKTIERTLKTLRPYSTPELVALSHHEPSWQNHTNGEVYTITPADLKVFTPTAFPGFRFKIRFNHPSKADEMQAHLLRGMISDIVRESTDLEYPDETGNDTSSPSEPEQNPNKSKGESA